MWVVLATTVSRSDGGAKINMMLETPHTADMRLVVLPVLRGASTPAHLPPPLLDLQTSKKQTKHLLIQGVSGAREQKK